MKTSFPVLLLIASIALTSGQSNMVSWQSFYGAAGDLPEVNVLESSPDHMIAEISIPGFRLYDYPGGGRFWDCVSLPECYSQGDIGLPDLPSVPRMFALPFGTEAAVTVEDVSSTVYHNMEILPRQIPEIDMAHDQFEFRINDEFYSGSEVFPASYANIDNEGIWSGLNVARLVFNPFRFNPSTGDLEVVHSITIRVDFVGTPGELANPVNPSMIPMMKQSVINWSTFENAAAPLDSGRDDGVEYVFVCSESNVDWVSDLFETHHYLGLRVRVETLASPSNPDLIKAAITDNYDTGILKFACIVGTHAEMPSYSWTGIISDYWFACLTAGDNYPEIGVGRLTGDSTQIVAQVTKIIDGYMNYSFDDSRTTDIIPSEAVLAAHQQDYPGKYTQCCNEIAAYPYSLCDLTFTKVYPPEDGTNADVSTAINNGIGTVTYRGHGSTTAWVWSAPIQWDASDIDALTNTFMPPVFNIACDNGEYQSSSTCLSESWQWAENGASGNLGATQSSGTLANHDYIKQIYIALYDTGTFRITDATNTGAVYIIENQGTWGINNARMYIWFGDPAMDIWTFDTEGEPGALLISAPANIFSGNQDITITVTDGSSPVEGANVTITDGVDNYGTGMTCYEEAVTNSSGQVTINITVPESGTIHIGAFLHDYNYDLHYIIIGTGVSDSQGDADIFLFDRPVPNPITVSASIGFSLPGAGNVELAVYDVSGRMVETILDGSLESGSHSIQWTPGSQIASGVYFIRLTTNDGTLTRQAMVIR
ncbi:MAG: T9SS type A sorting domain-containing protein [Candidatus Aegiribacteria sp.]|nr:T9SS type A sorting domain-containing protein [Candidatus Aegiribacteria sp.]